MPCFFCGSFAHLPQNCDKFTSVDSRQKLAESKNCCNHCFINLSKNFHNLNICRNNQKCYTCFSKNHHTFFCRDKNLLDSNIFLPNIDNDLIPRFMRIIDLEEQMLLTLSSTKIEKFVKPKKLTVIEKNNIHQNYKDANLLIIDTLKVYGTRSATDCAYLTFLESVLFKGKGIYIFRMINLCHQKFLHLLSPRLKYLYCNDVTLVSPINFMQILQAAPNLEIIDLSKTNIDIDNLWPEEIIKWKNRNKLRKLSITIPSIDFNVESLVTVINEKSKNYVEIVLTIFADNLKSVLENVEKKMMPYFNHVDGISADRGNVRVFVITNDNFIRRYFELKKKL